MTFRPCIVTAADLDAYWDRENATRRAAFAYVVALAGGAGVFATDTRTWWGLDQRDATKPPPAFLDPHSVLRNRRRTDIFRATGEWTWPRLNLTEGVHQ